jgi:hypothetical protein
VGRLSLGMGLLAGLLVLAGLLSPWTWLRHAAESPPTPRPALLTETAARAITAGDLPRARQHLEEALGENPHDARALFLQACLALEAGEIPVAEPLLAQLRSAAPERLEPLLLQRLLAHHPPASKAGWRQAFLQAWSALGRPSFVDSPWLLENASSSEDFISADAWRHASSAPSRLALVLLTRPTLTPELARELVEQLPTLKGAAWVQAVSVKLLARPLPPEIRTEALDVVRHRLTGLVEASPGVIQPRLLLLWSKASEWETLSLQELETLEELSVLPTWSATSFTQTFLDARAQLQTAGVAYPGLAASELARLSTNTWALVLLGQRAERTRAQLHPEARHRLGRILWGIGSRLRQDPTVFVRHVGLQLMEEGAMDMGDEAERESAAKALEESMALLAAAEESAVERWPLPSLWEEVAEARARDEWAHWREFANAR